MVDEKRQIFQQKALDNLRNPERFDQSFTIVPPIGWLTISAVALIVFSVLIWSIFGIMADKVNGYGIIIDEGGVAIISSLTGGRIIDMGPMVGERIDVGEVVAMIEQPNLQQNFLVQREQLDSGRSNAEIGTKAAQLSGLKDQIDRDSKVTSPHSGIVSGRLVSVGDVISSGTPLYSVRKDGRSNDKIALIYVPALEGAKVKPGMTIQVSPGSVDAKEYGSIVGRVSYVSTYPVALASIKARTGNSELANWFMQSSGGAVVEVYVELIKDNQTVSGYLWTSIEGAKETILPGTACTGTVIVKREAPIVKAFQKFSQWIRSD